MGAGCETFAASGAAVSGSVRKLDQSFRRTASRLYSNVYAFRGIFTIFVIPWQLNHSGKYPPAEPGALWCEPLKAAPVALRRPEAATQFQICIWSIRLSSSSWLRM